MKQRFLLEIVGLTFKDEKTAERAAECFAEAFKKEFPEYHRNTFMGNNDVGLFVETDHEDMDLADGGFYIDITSVEVEGEGSE